MRRNQSTRFLGGAVVFPGGRVENDDGLLAPTVADPSGAWWDLDGIAARAAACRESIEEVGIAPITGDALSEEDATVLRAAAAAGRDTLRAALTSMGRALDIAALVPFARWVTPEAESRRYDTMFFVCRAPTGQREHLVGLEAEREATEVRWDTPAALLADFDAQKIALVPPTHRSLEVLASIRDVDSVLAWARSANLAPICPRFVLDGQLPTLALPGDPLHESRTPIVAGGSRYQLVDGQWLPRTP